MLRLVEYESRPAGQTGRLANRTTHRRSQHCVSHGYGQSYRIALGRDHLSAVLVASDDFLPGVEEEWADAIRQAALDEGSLRALSRRSGIPRSTLQGIISGRTAEPSQRTIDRFLGFMDNSPVERSGRKRTVVDDSARWTSAKLANLEPPTGATFFQLIGKPSAATGQVSHTQYIDLESHHPADFLSEPGFRPQDVSRVVWAFGPRRG